jgi:uncharacterized protein (DUF2345 family)
VIIGDTVTVAPFSGLLPMPVHFTDRLKLVNDVTGEPMPDHPYVIQRADGRLEHGVSDANGFTHPSARTCLKPSSCFWMSEAWLLKR